MTPPKKKTEPSYTVVSAYVVGCEPGDTITAADLNAGTNLAALEAAGHIKPVTAAPTDSKDK